ncbi:MAG: hypothetical protein ACOVLB_00530 [Candidatus Nanopelagicus sp.]
MGRPLKIAKAQAVLTITDTATDGTITVTNNLITVPNVGVSSGMPFMVATTVGGLTANVTYYVLEITGNNTFTASSTQLSVQPRTFPTLSATSGGSVLASVGVVDAYFNNPVGGDGFPATNANTYSVVGGNTAIIGKQVLANVCIGQTGTGTLYASDASNVVGGLGTDLGNIATTSIIQYVNSTGGLVTLGYVDVATGVTTVAVANTQNTGNIIGTSGNAETLYVNLPVAFSANLGNLVTGTTYFVKAIANADAFTVSTTVGGAEVDLSSATGTPDATQDTTILVADASANLAGSSFVFATPEAGYIVRQKGKQKYLVTGTVTGLTGQCYTANLANTALTPNTMSIIATYANAATQTVQSLSDHTGELFTATSGPIATGNIVFENAAPIFASFNSAAAPNVANAQPYDIVTIASA